MKTRTRSSPAHPGLFVWAYFMPGDDLTINRCKKKKCIPRSEEDDPARVANVERILRKYRRPSGVH